MGLFEDIGNWFEQAVEDVGEAFEDVGEWVEQAAEDVGEWVEQAAEDIGEVVVDVATGIVDAAEDVAEWTLNVLDDTVFDTVDFLTGGVIDVDYDDGQFSAGLDIGIASVGVSFGEQGFSAESSFDIGLASGEISYDSADGLAMSGSIGAEWLPLPYAEGHMTFGNDGTISIGGRIQGTLPLPFGDEIGGSLSGGFERNADGSWGATADLELDASGAFGDISIDATRGIGQDADGALWVESETDVDVDLDLDLNPLDDLLPDTGVPGPPGLPGLDREFALDPLTGEPLGPIGAAATAGAAAGADDGGDVLGQGLESEPTRPDVVGPTDLPPVDDFDAQAGSAEDFAPVDPAFEEAAVPAPEPMPEPAPEPPPPSDFAVEIETIDTFEDAAADVWEDLG